MQNIKAQQYHKRSYERKQRCLLVLQIQAASEKYIGTSPLETQRKHCSLFLVSNLPKFSKLMTSPPVVKRRSTDNQRCFPPVHGFHNYMRSIVTTPGKLVRFHRRSLAAKRSLAHSIDAYLRCLKKSDIHNLNTFQPSYLVYSIWSMVGSGSSSGWTFPCSPLHASHCSCYRINASHCSTIRRSNADMCHQVHRK